MDRGPDPGDDVFCVWVGDTRGALSPNVSQVPEHNPLLSEAGVICAFLQINRELGWICLFALCFQCWGWNWGPHACPASALLLGCSPASGNLRLKKVTFYYSYYRECACVRARTQAHMYTQRPEVNLGFLFLIHNPLYFLKQVLSMAWGLTY